jgi:hypothetical protein
MVLKRPDRRIGRGLVMEWSERCEAVTEQTRDPTEKGQNYDTVCKKCGHKNFHIQGFNYNLM